MQKITLLLVMLSLSLAVRTQELKCTVTVRHQQVQGTNTNVFEALKKSSEDLLNTTRWTNLTYKPEERIECSMSIVVKSYENGIMDCELLVQARRPVWGSNYNTTILNFRDPSVKFAYQDFDALIVNQSFDKNLVAILAYYSYVIIGYSLDSFQKLGGNDAFSQAENIVNISQSRSEPESAGWRAFDKNGKRYELINNLLDERFGKFSQYFYDYHQRARQDSRGAYDARRDQPPAAASPSHHFVYRCQKGGDCKPFRQTRHRRRAKPSIQHNDYRKSVGIYRLRKN